MEQRNISAVKDVKIGKAVLRGEDVYFGELVAKAPDIVLVASDDYNLTGVYHGRVHNAHALEGIFAASGANIKRGGRIDIEIVDLVPTILHLMGLSIPDDMDGRVLKEIFSKESDAYMRGVTIRSTWSDETDKIRRRTQALKKLRKI